MTSCLLDLIDDAKSEMEKLAIEEKIIAVRSALAQKFWTCTVKIKTILGAIEERRIKPRRSMVSSSFVNATLTNRTIKIQDLPVPEFDGKIQNFPDWFNELESMINKNDNLDNFQKMDLLKRAMTGEGKTWLKDYGTDPNAYPLVIEHTKKNAELLLVILPT